MGIKKKKITRKGRTTRSTRIITKQNSRNESSRNTHLDDYSLNK